MSLSLRTVGGLIAALVVATGLAAQPGFATPGSPAATAMSHVAAGNEPEPGYRSTPIPHRYVVIMKKHASPAAVRRVRRVAISHGATILRNYRGAVRGLASHMSSRTARLVRRQRGVKVVVADRSLRVTGTQSNPPWGLDRVDQRVRMLDGYYGYDATGAGVTAYVIDTGIRATHTQFGGRVAHGFTAVNDGRGSNDCNGHGTHVAGTIGGSTYGVAEAVTLVPVRVLDCTGHGSTSQVIAGLDWVTRTRTRRGPAVANMSLGGTADPALDLAVARVVAAGVPVVVAAGNDYGANSCDYSPAREHSALTVASSTGSDARSSFSNAGPCVDIFAPGSSILSASIASDTASALLSGTSMAAPHVTGITALWLQSHPSASAAAASSAVLANATVGIVSGAGPDTPNRLAYSHFPAPTPPPPSGSPRVALSQGASAPAGYWYAASLSGFSPGSTVTLTCRDSVDPGGFYSQTITIASNGTASDSTLCYSGDGPDHWVTGGGVESNHVTWGGSAPPPPSPSISLARGGSGPAGYWYAVALNGFSPGSVVTVTCHDSVDPGGFYSQSFTVASNGTASDSTLCYSGDGPDHWITGSGVESNHVSW